MTREELIALIRERAFKLGRVPTPDECHDIRFTCRNLFGTYTDLIKATGLAAEFSTTQLEKKYQKLCSRREQIQGFFRHTLDLKELFDRAGNPPSLKCVAQPDTHVKFIDPVAFSCFLKFLLWYNPHLHLILGDFADCEGLSHWEPGDMQPRRIVPEMKLARKLLEKIVAVTPKCSTRIFLEGNHENWIEQALQRMPELFEHLEDLGIEVSVRSLLNLERYGYQFFPLNHLVQIGEAHFTHGIYTSTHHAKKHLDTFKCNIYYGHLHDTQESNATSIYGPIEAVSLGCLCRLDAKFLKGKPNNWVHSFGVFEFFPDGNYTFFKPKIINGRMSFCGEVFTGDKDL